MIMDLIKVAAERREAIEKAALLGSLVLKAGKAITKSPVRAAGAGLTAMEIGSAASRGAQKGVTRGAQQSFNQIKQIKQTM